MQRLCIIYWKSILQVDSLKDRLDEKHKELVKMHESNQDLKSRLQTVVREKDISQVRKHTAGS